MQRLLIMLMALTMSVGAVAAAEAEQPRRTDRTVHGSYGPYPAPVTGCHSALGPFACLVVDTRPVERFFSARVTDNHGQPVHVEVFSESRRIAAFCGQTATATAFPGGSHARVPRRAEQLVDHAGLPHQQDQDDGEHPRHAVEPAMRAWQIRLR